MALTKTDAAIAVLLFVGAVVLYLPAVGDAPLRNEDERRDIQICREMTASGSYVALIFNDIPYPDKPPLYFWSVIAVGRITGEIGPWEARLPSVVTGALLVVLLFVAGTLWGGRRAGLLAAAVIATAVTFHEAREARMNMMMTFLVACATLALLRADTTRRIRWGFAAGIAMGLAMLTKGPFGLLMPLATVGLFALWERRDWRAMVRVPVLASIALTAAIFLAWYIPAMDAGVGNHLDVSVSYHVRPVYYYLGPVFRVLAPWSILLIPAVGWLFSDGRHRRESSALFAFIWLVATFIVVSIYPPKRLCYLLFLGPPFALFMGWYLKEMMAAGDDSIAAKWHDRLLLFLVAVIMVVMPAGVWIAHDLFPAIFSVALVFSLVAEVMLGATLFTLHLHQRALAVTLFIAVMVAAVAVANTSLDPILSRLDAHDLPS